jgi:hypothetical protein
MFATEFIFSFAQDLWVKGKELPILDGILNAIEATANHVISGEFSSDLRAIEYFKTLDDLLSPSISSLCVIADSVISHVGSTFVDLFGSSSEKQSLSIHASRSPEEQIVQDALAFKHSSTIATDDLSNSSESPRPKVVVAHKKNNSMYGWGEMKHKRFSLLSPKRRFKKNKKRYSAIQKDIVKSATAELSPVKSDQGETLLIKEAIKYISSEDFSDTAVSSMD